MSMKEGYKASLQMDEKHFFQSISSLTEDDSNFKPTDEMFTAAAQIAHVGHTIDWFFDAAFHGKPWDMNFEAAEQHIKSFTSIEKAKAEVRAAFARAYATMDSISESDLMDTFPPDDPILPNLPKLVVIGAITDHSAHHRGALTVYARLRGKVPPMPYMSEDCQE